jgi:uncharacterized protein (DUF1697 family)
MPRYFAFLRAINVGGHIVKMERLRELFESLGFVNVETFIASGNVIFETKSRTPKALKKKIEELLRESLGYEVATFLRTDKELIQIARYRAFADSALAVATSHNIGFIEEPLSDDAGKSLMELQSDIDQFHINGREVYWLSRMKQGESTFSNAVFERVSKSKATFRGVNTISRLAAKYLD